MVSTLISLHSRTKDSALQRAGPSLVEYMNGCLHTICMGCGEKKKHFLYTQNILSLEEARHGVEEGEQVWGPA